MDYPDPDEEFELMHAEELEMMRELEGDFEPPDTRFQPPKSKRSLDFSAPQGDNSAGLVEESPLKKSNNFISESQPFVKDICAESLSNKRSVEYLFGDIDDIEIEGIQELKKRKLEQQLSLEERQNIMIEKIVKIRKESNEIKMKPNLTTNTSRNEKCLKDYMTRRIPHWDFMPVCETSGRTFYLRMYSQNEIDNEIKEVSSSSKREGLLSEPFYELYLQAFNLLKKNSERDKGKENTNPSLIKHPELISELWVERYKPRSYIQLLSDEGTNRSLLQWLKLWDKAVFNREKKIRTRPKAELIGSEKAGKYPELSEQLDELGRPHYKVALLCGPPGLGKTTLAHMIAKQAGYNIVEVNASDDRSPEIFRNALETATQMKSVMGQSPKPNCLILDEIDGAPLASIEVLVKFASDKGGGKAKKGKKAANVKGAILKRPIICICNDVYAPALRPLRQMAFNLHVPPISSDRLGERLVEVCRDEGLKSDLGAMIALADRAGRDVRASLSALQLLRASPRVGLAQVKALPAKDTHHGLFTVWQNIFQKPKKSTVNPISSSRMQPVLRMVQSCGEYERLCQGVFENYPNMKFRDVGMTVVGESLSWFCMFDLLLTTINTTQNYVLYPYLPYAFGCWHLLFSTLAWQKLNYPSTAYEVSQKQLRSTQVINWSMSGMPGHLRPYSSKSSLLLDTAPYLLHIVVPQVRPVASQLFTPAEKKDLTHVISVMIDYNLTYTQERMLDGNYVYNLDPNLEEVVKFKDMKNNVRMLSYGGKQMIHREIETEKLRRAEINLFKNSGQNRESETSKTANQNDTATPPKQKKKETPAAVDPKKLLNLTPRSLKRKEMEGRDFFGRIVETSLVAVQEKAKMDDIVKSNVWFHFKEGYNNAVRRNVLISDLL